MFMKHIEVVLGKIGGIANYVGPKKSFCEVTPLTFMRSPQLVGSKGLLGMKMGRWRHLHMGFGGGRIRKCWA